MFEKGQGDQYRGKSIDEININVNNLISGESSDDEMIESQNQATSTPRASTPTNFFLKSPILSPPTKMFTISQIANKNKLKITEKKIKSKITITPWNDQEKSTITKYFKNTYYWVKPREKKNVKIS